MATVAPCAAPQRPAPLPMMLRNEPFVAVPCLVKACGLNLGRDHAALTDLFQSNDGVVTSFGTWECAQPKNVRPITVVHALAGDSGPVLRVLPDTQRMDARQLQGFKDMHTHLAANARAIVIRYGQPVARELVLAPAFVKAGGRWERLLCGQAGLPGRGRARTFWGRPSLAVMHPAMPARGPARVRLRSQAQQRSRGAAGCTVCSNRPRLGAQASACQDE